MFSLEALEWGGGGTCPNGSRNFLRQTRSSPNDSSLGNRLHRLPTRGRLAAKDSPAVSPSPSPLTSCPSPSLGQRPLRHLRNPATHLHHRPGEAAAHLAGAPQPWSLRPGLLASGLAPLPALPRAAPRGIEKIKTPRRDLITTPSKSAVALSIQDFLGFAEPFVICHPLPAAPVDSVPARNLLWL